MYTLETIWAVITYIDLIGSLVVTGVEDELRGEVFGGPAHCEGLGVDLRLAVYHNRERDFLRESEVD